MFLIREIFTKEATKWWFRVLVVVAVSQALVGSLLISVQCSPSRILEGKENSQCPGNVRRLLSYDLPDDDLDLALCYLCCSESR
jgi:hypothetical protein